jgi:hypothetical protein
MSFVQYAIFEEVYTIFNVGRTESMLLFTVGQYRRKLISYTVRIYTESILKLSAS